MKYRSITIEGNIGAGKTTLATLLSERIGARLILEEFDDNPFLAKFYENPTQYAFPVELFFMAERFKQLKDIHTSAELFPQQTVSDYLFFKSLLFSKVNLPESEYQLYQKLFDILHPQLPQPDLLIYLHQSVDKLQENIRRRNRHYEQQIPDAYLQSIQEMYQQYMRQYPMRTLYLDGSALDFIENPDHLEKLLSLLDQDYGIGIHHVSLI
jgi:deoxyguanosine kinase